MLGALALGAGASPAHAEPAPPERAVLVVVAGPNDEAEAMRDVVVELLGRLGVDASVAYAARIDPAAVITPTADGRRPVARAWIDLATPERATVYVVDAPWERILTRHVARAAENAELTREELGHILETTVEAMLAGARIGVERVRSSRAAPSPRVSSAREPGQRRRPRARDARGAREASDGDEGAPPVAGGGFVGWALAPLGPSAPPSHGPVVGVSLELPRAPLQAGVWASGQLRLPQVVDREPIGLSLQSGALRLMAVAGWQLSPSLRLRFGAGGGADITHVEPRADGSGPRLAQARWLALPAVSAMLGPEIRLGPGLSVLLATTCDIDPSDTRYLSQVDGRPLEVLAPWRVRPGLVLGARVSTWREGAR